MEVSIWSKTFWQMRWARQSTYQSQFCCGTGFIFIHLMFLFPHHVIMCVFIFLKPRPWMFPCNRKVLQSAVELNMFSLVYAVSDVFACVAYFLRVGVKAVNQNLTGTKQKGPHPRQLWWLSAQCERVDQLLKQPVWRNKIIRWLY